MPASSELVLLEAEILEFSDHLETTAGTVETVNDILGTAKSVLELPGKIHDAAGRLEKVAKSGGVIAETFAKIGFLKVIARPFKEVLYEVSDTFKKIDDKAEELATKFKPYIDKMEKGEDLLTSLNETLVDEAAATKGLSGDISLVNDRLNNAQIFVLSSVNSPEALAIKGRLTTLFSQIDQGASYANLALVPMNNIMQSVETAASDLRNLLDLPDFQMLIDFTDVIQDIEDALGVLAAPLSAVYDAVGPVLDALSSIFGFLLKPLEAVLDAVVEATGIKGLIDEAAAYVTSLLPDINVLDTIKDALANAMDVQFNLKLDIGIVDPLIDLLAKLNPTQFLPSVIGPVTDIGENGSDGNDMHLALFHGEGGEYVRPTTGDDLIIGGEFNDTLNGGAGVDFIIGGGGDDTIDGGTGAAGERDVVIYSGYIDDYAIVSELGSDGLNHGVWYISDYSMNSDTPDGYDKLINVEDIVFLDATVPIGDLDTYIRTRSIDGSHGDTAGGIPVLNPNPPLGEVIPFAPTGSVFGYFISRYYSDVREIGPGQVKTGPILYTSNGVDWVFTGTAFEEIWAGPGKDQITSVANGPISQGQGRPGDILGGEAGDDVFLIGAGSGIYDLVYGGTGTDSIVYQSMTEGMSVFMGTGVDYSRFRPTTQPIDVDFNGRFQDDRSLPKVGVIRDVENINGTDFDDYFWGSAADNIIIGRTGNDQIRGLDGNDILRGGDGGDTIVGDRGDDIMDGGDGYNEFIGGWGSDTITADSTRGNMVIYGVSSSLTLSKYNPSFVDFSTTGYAANDFNFSVTIYRSATKGGAWVTKYDTNQQFIGEDWLKNIDTIVGTAFDDRIEAPNGLANMDIRGGDGNDTLYGGAGDPFAPASSNRLNGDGGDDDIYLGEAIDRVYGGGGSDTVYVGAGQSVQGDYFEGGTDSSGVQGVDVLDLSATDYSWQIYLNDGSGAGDIYGKAALGSSTAADPKFIQPTSGVNGAVTRVPGTNQNGQVLEAVNFELRVPDANTTTPGGRGSLIGFEVILASENRDIIAIGSDEGAMSLYGNGGADVLFSAQTFSDSIYGGDGNDVLGTYNQTFGRETVRDNFTSTKVVLLDAGDGEDTIVAGEVREDIFGGVGTDEVTYESGRGGVTVDLETGEASGGYAEGDHLESIENLVGSVDDDILTGDSGTNVLLGYDGNDTISGGHGDDVLFGNAGDDVLAGGQGNDQLHGGTGANTLDGGDGIDTAIFSERQTHPKGGAFLLTGDPTGVAVDLASHTAGASLIWNIENVKGSLGHDTIFGDAGDNVLAGDLGDDILDGRAGDDVLEGGEGDDTLAGGEGNDWLTGGAGTNLLDGGAGYDTLDYGIAGYGLTIDMAGAGARATDATGLVTRLAEFDRPVWSDSVTTIADPNGRPGDTIQSGTDETRYTYQVFDHGNDDPSDDTYRQEDPITPERLFRLDAGFARNPADLAEVRYLPDDVLLPEQQFTMLKSYETARDYFTGFELIASGSGADVIQGNGESTTFNGGFGADTIDGGAGLDTADYTGSEAGVTVNLASGVNLGGDADGDVLTGIENLNGSAFADLLTGDAGDNLLAGRGGNDSLFGGAGTDTAIFDVDSTEVSVGFAAGGFRITRAEGNLVLEDVHVGADIELFRFADGTLDQAQLTALINQGNDLANTLIGTAEADILPGLGGDDRIEARGADDTLDGGSGNDTLLGEGGNDSLIGGTGADDMFGGAGDDIYVVDDAGDIVTEARDAGTDTVQSSVTVSLGDNVENATLDGAGDIDVIGNDLDNRMTGNSGNNLFVGDTGSDTVVFDVAYADVQFDFSEPNYFLVISALGTDRLEGIEFMQFSDQLIDVTTLRDNEVPTTSGRLNSGDYFNRGSGIDTSREGGGTQFLYFGTASQGSNRSNQFHFTTEFEDGGGRAFYQGQGFNNYSANNLNWIDTATVNSIRVDFQGGNSQDVSIDGLNLRLYDLLNADWAFFETNVFNRNDTMNGSYYDDHLLGYAGNDTILGGNGDKEKYDISDPNNYPNSIPSRLRNPGDTVTDPSFFVHDGNDTLDGDRGDDLLDGGTGNDLLIGGAGDDQLWGGGDTGNDTLIGGAGNDTLFGGGGVDEAVFSFASTDVSVSIVTGGALIMTTAQGVDRVEADVENFRFSDATLTYAQVAARAAGGGVGNDTLRGTANNDTIDGGDGDDVIEGLGGNDRLLGGDGNDSIFGGDGRDSLSGNAGIDHFEGGAGNDLYADIDDAAETIFEARNNGYDTVWIHLDYTLSENIEELVVKYGDTVTGTGNSGDNLMYGVARVNNFNGMGGSDTLIGYTGNDSIEGGDGNDSLDGGTGSDHVHGGAGNDTIDGGVGADHAMGGDGDDLFYVDNLGDVVAELSDNGTDTVISLVSLTLPDNVENLTLTGNDNGSAIGNDLANVLIGDASNNTLHGGTGDDTIVGGAGYDTATFDVDLSQVMIAQGVGGLWVSSTEGVDFVSDDVEAMIFAGGARFVNYDDAVASFPGRVAGTELDDNLRGGPMSDRLIGRDGNDRIQGLNGNDTLEGGLGQDTLSGEDGNDRLLGGAGVDSLEGGSGNDLVMGDAGNDHVHGGDGNDTLDGGTGADHAMGGTGDDVYVVDQVGDVIVEAANAGQDAVYTSVSFTLPQNVETIVLMGTGNLDATGNAAANRLVGNAFDNVLTGAGGADTINGGVGVDTAVIAGTRAQADVVQQGDQIAITRAGATSIFQEVEFFRFDDTTLTATEVLIAPPPPVATEGPDSINGTSGDDSIAALGGNDTVLGFDGNDTLAGDGGDDALYGHAGADLLLGNLGNDRLDGGDGADSIYGGDGTDTLIGGLGDDFLFGGSTGADLRDVMYGGEGDDKLEGGYGNDEMRGDAGNDTLEGSYGADTVIGGAGDDVVTGAAWGDLLYGGDGNDFINGGFGYDRVNGGAGADKFYHLGVAGHGSDWIQDYNSAAGDVLMFGGGAAAPDDFLVQRAFTPNAGQAGVREIFVTQVSTGNLLWALVDGDAQAQINIQIQGQVFDLLA